MVLDCDFDDYMNTMTSKRAIHRTGQNHSPSENHANHSLDKRYDEYKDSGVEWMGEIPSHWDNARLAFIGTFSKGAGVSKADLVENGSPVILYGDIYTKYDIKVATVQRYIPPSVAKNGVKIVKGDILFAGSGETKEDIGKCIMYAGDGNGYAGGDVIIFRPRFADPLYLSYVLNNEKVRGEKAKNGQGGNHCAYL